MGRDVATKESQSISSAFSGHHQPVSLYVSIVAAFFFFFFKQAEAMAGEHDLSELNVP